MTDHIGQLKPELVWRNRIVGYGEEAPDQLAANPKNWRIHPEAQQGALKGSLDQVGWVDSVIVNSASGFVLDGHLRVSLALRHGVPSVPVTYVDLTDEEESLILASFDPIAAMAAADAVQLRQLLDDISADDANLQALLDELRIDHLGDEPTVGLTDPDAVPEPPAVPITKPGDLWLLGKHRLLCGDATVAADVARLMDGEKAVLLATDPPYGVGLRLENAHEANNSAKGVQKTYRHFEPIVGDDLRGDDLRVFLVAAFNAARAHLTDDAAWYVWHAWACQTVVAEALDAVGVKTHSQIVWVKPHFVFGRSDYHWQHEPCFYGWNPGHRPPFYGERNQSTVWTTDLGGGAIRKDQHHPTEKPVALFERPILNHSKSGDVCYEPFTGSGTALIAAEQHGRSCRAIEVSSAYCDVIVTRFEHFTGQTAQRVTAQTEAVG